MLKQKLNSPMTAALPLFLAAAASLSVVVDSAQAKETPDFTAPSIRLDGEDRMLTNSLQNMCGPTYGDALSCGAACPGGTDSECPPGEMCYADVSCPLPPTISPRPTRSPVKGFDLGNHDKQIIGYYASWQWYDRAKLAQPSGMDFNKVTRVNYAFFQLDADGNIWGTDEWADPRLLYGDVTGECSMGEPRCRCSWVKAEYKSCNLHDDPTGLIWQVHQARAEIYPSIGGWTLSDPFPAMSADQVSRAIFARKCRQLIEDYDFDGIDLDWEYPGYADHSGTEADTGNFNLLLADIRKELDALGDTTGRFYGLTAALPCGPSNINNIDIQTVSQYLTEFNLMTYDFHGSWDPVTGVNSPLYDQANDPEQRWSLDGCVQNWVDLGAPKEKLNVGLAFYGRSFRSAKALGVQHGGTDDSTWEIDEGTPQYFNILDRINDMKVEWDEETATPYAFFDDGMGGMVSYDDEQAICLKTEYAIQENLAGFIIWELSGDVLDDLNTPLLDSLNRKLSEERTNCADPFGPLLDLTATTTEATTTEATTTTTSTTTTFEAPTTTTSTTTATTTTTEEETTTTSTTTEAQSTTVLTTTGETMMMQNAQPISSVLQMADTSGTAQSISSAMQMNALGHAQVESAVNQPAVNSGTSQASSVVAQPEGNTSETAEAVSSTMAESLANALANEEKNSELAQMAEAVAAKIEQYQQQYDGRKQVVRNTKKPRKPFRPNKEQHVEL